MEGIIAYVGSVGGAFFVLFFKKQIPFPLPSVHKKNREFTLLTFQQLGVPLFTLCRVKVSVPPAGNGLPLRCRIVPRGPAAKEARRLTVCSSQFFVFSSMLVKTASYLHLPGICSTELMCVSFQVSRCIGLVVNNTACCLLLLYLI